MGDVFDEDASGWPNAVEHKNRTTTVKTMGFLILKMFIDYSFGR
jgi:hypothetical protein